MTPQRDGLLPLTRAFLAAGILLTAGTGAGLWLLPADTADYWAWTIGAAPTASFLGAGYVGAAVSLGMAVGERRWTRARASVVSALVFTTLSLVVTARHPGPFAWGADAGALPRATAWTWLVVYVTLPPLAAIVLLLEGRRGADERRAVRLAPATGAVLALAACALGAIGLLLLAEWERLLSAWPWPLTPLTADLVGAWLVTAAVTGLWVSLREREAVRGRPAAAGGAVFALLALMAALRSWDDLDGGIATTVYLVAVVAALLGLAAFAFAAHRIGPQRAPGPYRPTS